MNEHKQSLSQSEKIGYNGIYLQRNGEDVKAMVQELMMPPEMPLGESEKLEAYSFEDDISRLEVSSGETLLEVIKAHREEDTLSPMVFAEALMPYNAPAICEKLALELPHFESHEEVYVWCARMAASGSGEAIRKIAAESIGYYKLHVERALEQEVGVTQEFLEVRSIVLEPDRTVSLAEKTREVRGLLLSLRAKYPVDQPGLDGAKRAIIDVYLARVNASLVSDFSQLVYLREQAMLIDDRETVGLVDEQLGALSGLGPESHERMLQRLDYMTNGMASNAGEASPISPQLAAVEGETRNEAVFSPAEKQILQTTFVSSERMQQAFTNIMQRARVLSTEPAESWSPQRAARASDGLFQVVQDPTKDTFTVSQIDGTLRVPRGPRSLYDAIVVGGFHEATHVDQVLSSDIMQGVLKIAAIKGKRVGMLREAGANARQRAAELTMFGATKPVASMTYANALGVLRNGGTLFEAAQAFYNTRLDNTPGLNRKSAAKEAADRVLRLLRRNRHNSQFLAYAEEGIFAEELADVDDATIARANAITSLDYVDQLRLHKYGLLPDLGDISHDWASYVVEEFAEDVQKALSVIDKN